MRIKVLFCSPYKQDSSYIQGGMAIWGANIINYANRLKKSEVELVPISFDRKFYIGNNISLVKRIVLGIKDLYYSVKEAECIMKTGTIDCVHICSSASLSLFKDLFLLRKAKQFGVKSYIHFHFGRIPLILEKGGWEKFLLKQVIDLSDSVITMNEYSFKALRNNGFVNVLNLPNPLSLEIIQKVKMLNGKYIRIPNRILYVGHVTRTKGVWELVEACSNIGGIELRIVGRVTDEQKVQLRQVAGNESDKWCHFVGEISHDRVLEEFQQAGLFVFPSYSEGFPNVILEAMASGCPIAASNVGAIPEILDINSNACGLCFLPRNINEVEKSIRALIFNEQEKKKFAEKASIRVHEKYAMPVVWQQMVEIWRSNL